MAFYEKKPSQLLVDLINEANPNNPIDLVTLENTVLGTPKVYQPTRRNQQVRLVEAFLEGSGYWEPPQGVESYDLLLVAGGGAGSSSLVQNFANWTTGTIYNTNGYYYDNFFMRKGDQLEFTHTVYSSYPSSSGYNVWLNGVSVYGTDGILNASSVSTHSEKHTYIASEDGEVELKLYYSAGSGYNRNSYAQIINRSIKSGTGAGGGAGGLVFIPGRKVGSKTRIAYQVGEGGQNGASGQDTIFDDLQALGGGAGADGDNGNPGGSGGGAGRYLGVGGRNTQVYRLGEAGDQGYGNLGGSNAGSPTNKGMGGGGAGQPGQDDYEGVLDYSKGGDGISGVLASSGKYGKDYRFVDVFGDSYGEVIDGECWFAGGGNGGHLLAYTGAVTASKGGGGSSRRNGRVDGLDNTGAGGAGTTDQSTETVSKGGRGIILVAYNNPLLVKDGELNTAVDTVTDAFPIAGSKYRGKVTFYYRRINLNKLFTHSVIRLDRWRAEDATTVDICKWVNEIYGTQLIAEDFPDTTFTSSPELRTLSVNDDSLAFTGSLQFIWEKGNRAVDQIITTNEFDGIVWDVRHGGKEDPRPLLTFTGYGADYTEFVDVIAALSNGAVVDENIPGLGVLVERYNRLYDTVLDLSVDHTQEGGLKGLTLSVLTLPNSTVDEANATRFEKVVAITSATESWFGGHLLFHYNPR